MRKIIIIILLSMIILSIFVCSDFKIEKFSEYEMIPQKVPLKNLLSIAQSPYLGKLDYLELRCSIKCREPDNYLSINKIVEYVPKHLSPINVIIVDNHLYQITSYGIYKYKLNDEKPSGLNALIEYGILNDIYKFNKYDLPIMNIRGKLLQMHNGNLIDIKTLIAYEIKYDNNNYDMYIKNGLMVMPKPSVILETFGVIRGIITKDFSKEPKKTRKVMRATVANNHNSSRVINASLTNKHNKEKYNTNVIYAFLTKNNKSYNTEDQELEDQELVDQELVDQELVDQELVDQELVDQELAEHKIIPQELAEQKIIPQELAEQKIIPQELAEQKIIPQELAEQKIIPQELAEHKIIPQELAEQKIIPQELVQYKMTQSEMPLPIIDQSMKNISIYFDFNNTIYYCNSYYIRPYTEWSTHVNNLISNKYTIKGVVPYYVYHNRYLQTNYLIILSSNKYILVGDLSDYSIKDFNFGFLFDL
jgi:hypothetical protein